MTGKLAAVLTLVGGLTFSSLAAAQPYGSQPSTGQNLNLVGAWSGQSARQGTTLYNPDGSFVYVFQTPSGSFVRAWGAYRASRISNNQVGLDLQIAGVLPAQFCLQQGGAVYHCTPNRMPPMVHNTLTFQSPSVMQTAEGWYMHRDATPTLLQVQIPQQQLTAVNTPVMPTLHPYRTPTGPGSVEALRRDTDLQQHRICAVNDGSVITDPNGRNPRCVN